MNSSVSACYSEVIAGSKPIWQLRLVMNDFARAE
jgi:hypothetical protein